MKAKHGMMVLVAAAFPALAAVNYESLVKSAESTAGGKAPIASLWQEQNRPALEAALADEAIAAFTDTSEAARRLLARVKPGYGTDPLDACRIAEVSHWVMVDADASWYEFWREHRSDRRRLWTDALLETAERASDEYVRIFCLDQLRWCGFRCQADRILKLGARAGSKPVRELAEMVARELGVP